MKKYSHLRINRSLYRKKGGSFVFRQPKTAKGKRTISLSNIYLTVLQEHYEKSKQIFSKFETKFNDETLVSCHPENGEPPVPNTLPEPGLS
jgi:hypothetical protein